MALCTQTDAASPFGIQRDDPHIRQSNSDYRANTETHNLVPCATNHAEYGNEVIGLAIE